MLWLSRGETAFFGGIGGLCFLPQDQLVAGEFARVTGLWRRPGVNWEQYSSHNAQRAAKGDNRYAHHQGHTPLAAGALIGLPWSRPAH
jgi:hypothetical protein